MYFVLIPISATTTTAPTTSLSSTPSSNPSASDILPSNGPCAATGCTELSSPKRDLPIRIFLLAIKRFGNIFIL